MDFNFKHSKVKKSDLKKELDTLATYDKQLIQATLDKKYQSDEASLYLPIDKINLKNTKILAREKQKLNLDYIVVIGIGGSNLGTQAVQEAILGKNYNLTTKKTKIFYADTVDTDSISEIIQIIEPELKDNKNILLNVVSKSGGTTETITNFAVLLKLLKKYKKDWNKFVVATTDQDSHLYNFARKQKIDILVIPSKVGGRYSVFSPVGLFPLAILGINVNKLLEGAKNILNQSIGKKANNSAISAAILFKQSKNKININDNFIFSKDLESIGLWYRQLMGESVGKEFNLKGKIVNAGITPTVSIGSVDLHSMAQLYLGGPYDKYTTFISLKTNKTNIKVPTIKSFDKLIPDLGARSILSIMDAIFNGTKTAFRKSNRPFCEISLDKKSEFEIGTFLQFKMLEMMYLGKLFKLNTFNQPSVEKYKIETKKILNKK